MAENTNVVVSNKRDLNIDKRIIDNYSALAPVLIIEKCVGLFRLCLKNGELQPPTWAMKFYTTSLAILYIILFCIFLRVPAVIRQEETLFNVIDDIPSFVQTSSYVSSLISSLFFLSKCNIKLLINISELDNQLLKTNHSVFYKSCRDRNIKCLMGLCLWHGISLATDLVTKYMDNEGVSISVIVFLVYFIQKLEILTFCIFVGMATERLAVINGYIAKFLEEKDNNCVFTLSDRIEPVKGMDNMIGRATKSNMKIRDLAMMYNRIGTICQSINSVNNFQIFMTLVSAFVYIVITIWTTLYMYRSDKSSGPLVTISIWCFTAILGVTVMCFVCERLRYVRSTTRILVNQIIMDYELPKTMRVQAKAFMELIDAWPLRICIYDMFDVDITLMLKFISVATTYLIVIIQVSHYT